MPELTYFNLFFIITIFPSLVREAHNSLISKMQWKTFNIISMCVGLIYNYNELFPFNYV